MNHTRSQQAHIDFVSSLGRRLAWLNIAVQVAFPLAVAFTPVIAGAEQHFLQQPAPQSPQRTQTYTLGPDETAASVAEKFHLTLEQLRELNQFRTLARDLDGLRPGDDVDVPVATARDKKTVSATSTALSSSVNASATGEEGQAQKVAGYASQIGGFLAHNPGSDAAASMATGEASGALQQWLGRFGTARIQLNMDRHGNWNHSSGDLLVPLYDNGQSLLFFQGGIRRPSDRLTGNLGYGVRTFWDSGWMYGGNVFFDDDFTGHNRRLGIGGEAWRDYLRLSANTYLGTTQWHTSRDFDDTWQEKPADGYDIRAEGWLPAYPQLGGKLVWEQYYGDRVALFDKDHLQQNPNAVTAGVEYTPVPLVTLGVDHRQGRGVQDTQLGLNLHWSLGQNWRRQVDPANVDAMRTLAGSRYELVNRNNEIVLKYRKNPDEAVTNLTLTLLTDNSPADGLTRNVLQVLATNRNGHPVNAAPVTWGAQSDAVSLTSAATVTDENGLAVITLTSTKMQTVPVTAQSGSIQTTQNTHFTAVTVSHIGLSVTHDNAPADGSSTDTVVATLTDGNGRAVTGHTVNWTLPEGTTLKNDGGLSDSSGRVTAQLASTVAGSGTVSAGADSENASVVVHFTGNAASAKISALVVTTDGSLADGKATNVAQATVTDTNGNALSGQTVSWKSSKSTITFGQSAVTDSRGKTTVRYTDTVAESLTLTASLANGNSATADSTFVTGVALMKDLTVTSGAKASGTDTNAATVTVTDASGNAISGQAVTFSVTGSAKLTTTTLSTDSSGKATDTLTDTVAETVQVTAKLSDGGSITKDSSFVTNLDSAVLAVTATTGALADGSSTDAATVTLKDSRGSVLAGQAITLSVSGSAKLSSATGTTDNNGQVQVTLTDTVPETVTITAALSNGKTASAQAAFITYTVTTLTTSATSVKADGSTSATLTATVKDGNGTVVADAPVSFSVTGSAVLSSTTVNTNSSGQAQIALTDSTGEAVTVTAKAKGNSSDAGKTQIVTFVASSITGVAPRGTTYTFTPDQGFPKTGMAGAQFYFLIDDSDATTAAYTWSSDRSWVTVDSDGIATMNASSSSTLDDSPPSSDRTVTITATPKTGGKALTYTFTLQKWYRVSEGMASVRIGGENYASSACNGLGTIESASDMSDGAVSVVGKLFGEWRDSPTLKFSFYWDTETTTTWRAGENIAFIYKTGVTSSASLPGSTHAMCRLN
ncbi:Ig-like domain-containing protein [Pantoea agglomerans]|uniref:Ig-like domain-containing protein n=1 Tax=Enterobacter agglomerans TaxID=549 RepID=UPI002412F9B5|nr:inverse autotransporter beta domain-containing protein [Pantoea agglomerans]